MRLSPQHALLLSLLTLAWGLNWPVMKVGVTGYPPLTFRALSMWLGLPLLYAAAVASRTSLHVPRRHWPELCKLTLTNVVAWHVLAIVSLPALPSGRAAILGYTMPIFSALWGLALYRQGLSVRQFVGVAAAAVGVALLLWHEIGAMAGEPLAAVGMLSAAALWALGTHQMRRTGIPAPTLAIVFWMTVLATLVLTLLATALEMDRWAAPTTAVRNAILYNALLIFGFGQVAWVTLARALPPAASTLSVMLIPVLGIASGAAFLGERLYWQDYAAMALMLVAIGSVLWVPRRRDALNARTS